MKITGKALLYLWGLFILSAAPVSVWAQDSYEPRTAGQSAPVIIIDEHNEMHVEETDAPATGTGQQHNGTEETAHPDAKTDSATESHSDTATQHHGEAPDGLPQFDPSSFPSQIFWFAVIFIILYGFFSRKTLPEISKVIETRTQHVQNDLNAAEELKEEAEKIQHAYEEILSKARQKSAESFTAAEQDLHAHSDRAHKNFRKQTLKEIEKTEKSIEKAKSKIMGDIDMIAARIAREAAEKIIGVKTDPKQAEHIVQSLQDKKKAA